MLGAVGLGAVWGWLAAMVWLAGPRSRAAAILGVASLVPGGLAFVAAGLIALLSFVVAAVGFLGLYVGWQWWLAGSSTRGRE